MITSEDKANAAQNAPQSQLEAIPATFQANRPRRSSKPPAVQAAIIAKAMNGESKTQIANDLNIARGTVYSVLSTAEIEQQVQLGRSRAVSLIPRSLDVMDTRLTKGSETAAIAILRGTQVLQSQSSTQVNNNSFAINLLQLKQQKASQPVLEAIPASLAADPIVTRKPGRPKRTTTNSVPDPAT